MEPIVVQNRFDTIEFEGELIGSATTRKDPSHDQWTEIYIYRTTGGKYVVQSIGGSVRYHMPDEKCTSPTGVRVTGSELGGESAPCPKCDPEKPGDEDFAADLEFVAEVTISKAEIVEDPAEIRGALEKKSKATGKMFLSSVAFAALQDAVRRDRSLLNVFERRVRL